MQGLCVLTGGRVGPHTDGLGKEGPREGSLGEGQVHRKFIWEGQLGQLTEGSRQGVLPGGPDLGVTG